MSYCRFGWDGSDAYVYPSSNGIECCGCRIRRNTDAGQWFTCHTPEEMIEHLIEHKKAGDFVPFYVIERLWEEVSGPNEPVRPEPEAMTKAKAMLKEARNKIKKESKDA